MTLESDGHTAEVMFYGEQAMLIKYIELNAWYLCENIELAVVHTNRNRIIVKRIIIQKS